MGATRSTGGILGEKVNVYQRNKLLPSGEQWVRLHGLNVSSTHDTGGSPLANMESGVYIQQTNTNFGSSIAMDNNNLVVGAPSADMHEGQVDVGMSYLYSMVPDAPTELNVQAGTSKVTAVKWTTPLSNAAPITKYFVTATPVSPIGTFSKSNSPTPISVSQTFVNSSASNEILGLINGQTYNLTVQAKSSVGDGLFSLQSNSIIPAEIPHAPVLSEYLLTQVAAQSSTIMRDATMDVYVTLPVWHGGGGLIELEVELTTISSGAVNRNIKKFVNSTNLNVYYQKAIFQNPANDVWWCNFTSLINGAEYIPKTRVRNWVGWSAWSSHNVKLIPASIPTSPSITSIDRGNTNVTIHFKAPLETGALLHYEIFVYGEEPTVPGVLTKRGMQHYNNVKIQQNWTTATSPYMLVGLTNGRTYQFIIRAYNWRGIGSLSIPSKSVVPASVPNAVTNLLAIPGDMNVTVMFTPPIWHGGLAVLSYTIDCFDEQGLQQPSTTILIDDMLTKEVTVEGNVTLYFTHVIVNEEIPLINGVKYQINVHATNEIGNGIRSTELCWPVFNGLRAWEIALLIIAPFLVILFVMLYIWKIKHRHPITCKKLKSPNNPAVAPAPGEFAKDGISGRRKKMNWVPQAPGLGPGGPKLVSQNSTLKSGGGMFDMSLDGPPKPTFINVGLDGEAPPPQSTMFDALRTGQAVHVANKRNPNRQQRKQEQRKKNRKRRQL